MDDILKPIIDLVPEKWRTTAALAIPASMILGRVYHSLRNSGGLKGIISAIWLGTNSPKPPIDTEKP